MVLKFLKISTLSILLSSNLFAVNNNIDSVVDIEVNKLNQMLKKEIELVNMIESYILLNPPSKNISGKDVFDPTSIKRQHIQSFYKIPNSYFNNYDDQSCVLNGSYCDDNNGGIVINVTNDTIEIQNLLGVNQKSSRNKEIFKRLHKKYKNIIFDTSYNTNGTIIRRFSNKIDSLRTNLNNYLINPYNNHIISYKKPSSSYSIWIKPDGEGSFYTYSYDSINSSWKQIGKNVITKYPTYANYSDLQNIQSFDGAIMYARYANTESNYAKYGEMEFINTGKSVFYPTSAKERWSVKAGNNIFIKDQINITNTCSELKNPLIGVDSEDRYIFVNSNGNGQKLEEKLSINSHSTYTTINAEQLFYFFRNSYEFKIDPNSALSKKIKLDYENDSDYNTWEVKKSKGSKTIKNNNLSFEVFNKISNNFDSISSITINKVKFWNPSMKIWIEKTPLNNVINGSNLRNFHLKFSDSDKTQLESLYISKYKSNVLGSGEIFRTIASPITFNTSNTDTFYNDLDEKTFDSNIDTIQGYPIIIDFSINVNSVCDSGKSYHDCYLVETSNFGCYISSLKSETK